MNYMVLAAGKGSRMGDIGSYLQKCMYPILDKPFLSLVLDGIIANSRFNRDKDRLVIVTGHKDDQIHSYFGAAWRSVPLLYVDQGSALGTAHAVTVGSAACDPVVPVIVVQGDVWAPPSYYQKVVDNPARNILSVHRHVCAGRHDERVDLSGNRVIRAFKGTGPFIECGVWKFSPELLGYMMSRKADEYRALVSVQAAIDDGIDVTSIERDVWIHLGGTEPTVRDNLAAVTRFFLSMAPSWS